MTIRIMTPRETASIRHGPVIPFGSQFTRSRPLNPEEPPRIRRQTSSTRTQKSRMETIRLTTTITDITTWRKQAAPLVLSPLALILQLPLLRHPATPLLFGPFILITRWAGLSPRPGVNLRPS